MSRVAEDLYRVLFLWDIRIGAHVRMYCQSNCNAVRISIPRESFAKWVSELSRSGTLSDTRKKVSGKLKASIFASDVLYGAVSIEGDRYNEKRRNALSWFGNCIHVENLGDYVWEKKLVDNVPKLGMA